MSVQVLGLVLGVFAVIVAVVIFAGAFAEEARIDRGKALRRDPPRAV
ncbi:MAG: hypothetical protein ACREM2_05325 [Vulcanimicrobiaceae bacterium]